jgi:hypothetical protein
VHRAGNFNLEWGFIAPAPSFLRAVRVVVAATAIGATTSAAVVFALMRQPSAEESIAARTLVQSVGEAPPTGRGESRRKRDSRPSMRRVPVRRRPANSPTLLLIRLRRPLLR